MCDSTPKSYKPPWSCKEASTFYLQNRFHGPTSLGDVGAFEWRRGGRKNSEKTHKKKKKKKKNFLSPSIALISYFNFLQRKIELHRDVASFPLIRYYCLSISHLGQKERMTESNAEPTDV